MKRLGVATALSIALTGWLSAAAAEPLKDDTGKGRENYQRDDNGWLRRAEAERAGCRVERKWDNGAYKEEIRCNGGRSPFYRN